MQARLISHRLSDHRYHGRFRVPARAILKKILKSAAFLVLLCGAACAHYEPPPPKAPVHHALRERTAPEEQKEDLKIHRAPPPDYGNKVVVCGEGPVPRG